MSWLHRCYKTVAAFFRPETDPHPITSAVRNARVRAKIASSTGEHPALPACHVTAFNAPEEKRKAA